MLKKLKVGLTHTEQLIIILYIMLSILCNYVKFNIPLSLSAMHHVDVMLEGFSELSYLLSFPLLLKDMTTGRHWQNMCTRNQEYRNRRWKKLSILRYDQRDPSVVCTNWSQKRDEKIFIELSRCPRKKM